MLEGQRSYEVLVRFNDASRNDLNAIRNMLIDTPGANGEAGAKVPLSSVAEISEGFGPNAIMRENVQRRIVISANVAERPLNEVVQDIQQKVAADVQFPPGYYIEYGGQFEAQQSASKLILSLSLFSLVAIYLTLQMALGHARAAIQVMVNIPLAIIGGVIAVYATGGVLSVASLIGFISLFGITSRNGIMMLSHYIHLMKEEGEDWTEQMIIRGSLERLVPVMMTALTAGLALVPLSVFAGARPAKKFCNPWPSSFWAASLPALYSIKSSLRPCSGSSANRSAIKPSPNAKRTSARCKVAACPKTRTRTCSTTTCSKASISTP